MLLYYTNYADVCGGVATPLVASSADPNFPTSFVQNYLAAKVWKALNVLTTETFSWNLTASASVVNTVILHNFVFPAAATVFLERSADGTTWTNTLTLSGNWSSQIGLTYLYNLAAPVTANYWRIRVVRTGPGVGIIQLGRAFLGSALDTGVRAQPDYGAFSRPRGVRVNQDYSIGGQAYAEQRANYYTASGRMSLVPESDMQTLRDFFAVVGTWTPFFVQFISGAADGMAAPFYVKLMAPLNENLVNYGSNYLWSSDFNLEEQL